ncbi:hypothetical protein GALMADRAFT_133584 [Galerina marginata CBS 339.88]|uniref:Ribosome assembly protein 3 n=1 Tax=Galerina marginata (strain CBS 339.88) TaxID=685588 RepID=A0A067TYU0_GALM3|nr:hypothetical protein GALMADRAFT_133584 [Galerina marginata CBS 339.88]
MAPAAAKPSTQRKRNRKRKRRAASSSSSSSSESDSSDNEVSQSVAQVKPTTKPTPVTESSSSESSSDSSSSDSEEEEVKADPSSLRGRQTEKAAPKGPRMFSPSPSPPPAHLPSFLPPENAESFGAQEQQLKDKFRQFWMSSVVDGFKDDLEEIRKEPNLGTSRLALLIDSLASGADIFNTSSDDTGTNEMEVVLN